MEIYDNIKNASKTSSDVHQDQNSVCFFCVFTQEHTSKKYFYQKPVIHRRNLRGSARRKHLSYHVKRQKNDIKFKGIVQYQ